MAQIRFNLKPVSGNKLQIRAFFQDGQKQKTKYTGYKISATKLRGEYKFWDKEKQLCRNCDNAGIINSLIEKWKLDFTTYKEDCKRLKIKIDIETFLKILAGEKPPSENPALTSIMETFLAQNKAVHKNTTYRGYKVIIGKIKAFQKLYKKEILVSQVDKTFYKDFSMFLMGEHNNTNATISRRLGKIITALNYAKEYLKTPNINEDYNKKYKLKTTPAAKFPLRPEELATLRLWIPSQDYKKRFNEKSIAWHQVILDAFLLACETGLRHSDILQLQPAHIQSHITTDGIIKFITLNNIKGTHENNMPLSQSAQKIIDKYLNNIVILSKAKNQPVILSEAKNLFHFHHSQSAGKVLKEIFKDCKLNRPCENIKMKGAQVERKMIPLHDIISFHMARNTYITRLLSSNLSPAIVQYNVGHRDLKTTQSYFRDDDISRWKETLKILNNPN